MDKSVELVNVSFKYPNGFLAVDNVSLSVEPGESIAIIGQNGAGKTTTVKLMNGLHRPSDGKVLVYGKNTEKMSTAKISRKVGYVFQNPSDQLFNNTVYKEIAYALKARGEKEERIDELVRDAAKLCHVDEYLDTNPYDLPLSIRKFVTTAIVIANECDVIILDEPTAGQDLFGVKWLEDIIKELQNRGKTIITITHDLDFVIHNFERVIVMANKKIVTDSNPKEIFWNREILEKAALKMPAIAELASRLELESGIVKEEDFIKAIKNKYSL